MKKILMESDIEEMAVNGVFQVQPGMIVTPLAREHASRKGIRLVYASTPSSERMPELGENPTVSEEALISVVMDEIARAVGEMADLPPPTAQPASSAMPLQSFPGDWNNAPDKNRAVIVATGMNQPGIAAAITQCVANAHCDIEDISQTIVSDFFSMIVVVNLEGLGSSENFRTFKQSVEDAGRLVGTEVIVMHEAILDAMHRV